MPPLLRHQESLETTLDFAASPFSSDQRIQGWSAFAKIIEYYNSYARSLPPNPKKYNRGKLLELIRRYAISDRGRDSILTYYLTAIGSSEDLSLVLTDLAGFEKKSKQEKDQIAQRVHDLAGNIVDYFFLPCKFV